MKVKGEVLWTDEWIQTTVSSLISSLVHMLKRGSRANYKDFKVVFSRRDKGISISYPGPDGQETVLKLFQEDEDD